MKTTTKILALLSVLVFSLGTSTNPQTVHEIILYVDTGAIDTGNIDQVSNFGQAEGIPNRDFTTVVRNGDIVLWKGVSSSAPDTDKVLIESINHEGGARVFGRNTLRDTDQNPGVVVGTVAEGRPGDEEKYKVSFRVENNGDTRPGVFNIDPKIQVRN